MTKNPMDPLRYLNIHKKHQSNKQKIITIPIIDKQIPISKNNQFVLPSFSSFNSLEDLQCHKIQKRYTPSKYFNPEVQEYLNKLKKIKIANSPMLLQQNNILKQPNKISNTLKQADKQLIPMITFSKNGNFQNNIQIINSTTITKYNFYNKQKQKKSGSFKMMQKIKYSNIQNNQLPQIKTVINSLQYEQYIDNKNIYLKQCQICLRKFNQISYQKHIKICDKVFFQKRKPFYSRSNSLTKNQFTQLK